MESDKLQSYRWESICLFYGESKGMVSSCKCIKDVTKEYIHSDNIQNENQKALVFEKIKTAYESQIE